MFLLVEKTASFLRFMMARIGLVCSTHSENPPKFLEKTLEPGEKNTDPRPPSGQKDFSGQRAVDTVLSVQ